MVPKLFFVFVFKLEEFLYMQSFLGVIVYTIIGISKHGAAFCKDLGKTFYMHVYRR